MIEAQKIAEMLKNAYGYRAKVVVDLEACDCPTMGCTGELEIEGGNYGLLEEEVGCIECSWEGTCEDLLR